MSWIELEVPYVSQTHIGAHANNGTPVRTELSGCWYAASCMVGYFWESGPRLGVPKQYKGWFGKFKTNPDGMGKNYDKLKKNEGFAGVVLPSSKKWTVSTLLDLVTRRGPCYVRRGFRDSKTGAVTGGHAIVLIGANYQYQTVACLDPEHPDALRGRREYGIDEFNGFFKWNEKWEPGISMMYKKQEDEVAAALIIKEKRKKNWVRGNMDF